MDSFSSIQTKTFQEETLSIRCQLQTSKLEVSDSHQHSSLAKWKYMCQMHGIEINEEQHSYPIQLGLFYPFHGLEVQRHESHSNPKEEEEKEEEITAEVTAESVEFGNRSIKNSRLTFIPFVAPWSRSSSRSSSVHQSSYNDDESQTSSLSLTVSNQRQSTIPQHLYTNPNLDHPSSYHHEMHNQYHNNPSMLPMRLLTRPQSPFPHQRIRSSEVSRTMFSCTKERGNHDEDMDNSIITSDSPVSLSRSHHSGIKFEQDTITIFLHQITKVHCVDALNIVLHTPSEEYVITTESTNGRDLLHAFLKRFLPNSTACFDETSLEERHEILHNTLRSQVSRTESMDMQKFQDYAMNKSIEHDTHVDKIWRWSKRVICDMTNICFCGEVEGTHENVKLSNDLNTATKGDHDDCQTEISEALELDLDDYQHL